MTETTGFLKIKDLLKEERVPSFLSRIDLFDQEGQFLIGTSGTLALGFILEGRDLLLEEDAAIKDFEARMNRFLNQLPQGLRLHFLVRGESVTEEIFEEYEIGVAAKDEITKRILESRKGTFKKSPFFKKEIFLFVVLPNLEVSGEKNIFCHLGLKGSRKHSGIFKISHEDRKLELQNIAEEIKNGLLDLGFSIEPLMDAEILKYLYEFLNPGYSREIPFEAGVYERFTEDCDRTTLRSKLLMAVPRVHPEYIYLDGYYHQVLNLKELPEATTLRSLKDFEMSLGKDFLYSLNVEVADTEKEKRGIKRSLNFSKAESFFSRTKAYEALGREEESDELLTELAQSRDKLFHISFSALARDKNPEKLREKTNRILKAFTQLGNARGLVDHLNHDRLFLSFLPLQGIENPLQHLVRTKNLIHFLPLQESWKGTPEYGLLLKTYRDEPLKLDIFDERLKAKHALMLGTTGSGKSFFTNQLILQFLMEGEKNQVVVIDMGGSYRKLASSLGGVYLEVECDEIFAMSPFPRKALLLGTDGKLDSGLLQFLKEILQKMIRPKGEFSSSEKMILEKAVFKVYDDLKTEGSPVLGDVENALRNYSLGDEEDRKTAYQFAKELMLFTEGSFGKILNRRGQFLIDSRFIVFDLRKISNYPELQEILLLIIPFTLRRKFEDVSIKKLIVLDECWQLLKDIQGRELIEVFYRTARKFNAGVLSITQNPEDFLDASIAGSIINNSSIKYILRLHQGHEKLKELGLNDNEIQAVKELEVKKGLFSEQFIDFDGTPVVSRLEPSPIDYWLSTTDSLDRTREEELKKEKYVLTDFEIVEELAEKYPHGAARGADIHDAA